MWLKKLEEKKNTSRKMRCLEELVVKEIGEFSVGGSSSVYFYALSSSYYIFF